MQLSIHWIAVVIKGITSAEPNVEILMKNDEPSRFNHLIKWNPGRTCTPVDRMRRCEVVNTHRLAHKRSNVGQQTPREPTRLVHRHLEQLIKWILDAKESEKENLPGWLVGITHGKGLIK
jgi:hypothetical protein